MQQTDLCFTTSTTVSSLTMDINLVLFLLVLQFVTNTLAAQSLSNQYNTTQHKKRSARSLTMWDYFPLLVQNLHEAEADYEEMPSIMERDTNHQEYRPLCPAIRHRVDLKDNDYEYRPPHYVTVTCKYSQSSSDKMISNNSNMKCSYPGFECVQRSRTIYLTKRRYESDCWESFSLTIPSNCECMWPQSLIEAEGR